VHSAARVLSKKVLDSGPGVSPSKVECEFRWKPLSPETSVLSWRCSLLQSISDRECSGIWVRRSLFIVRPRRTPILRYFTRDLTGKPKPAEHPLVKFYPPSEFNRLAPCPGLPGHSFHEVFVPSASSVPGVH